MRNINWTLLLAPLLLLAFVVAPALTGCGASQTPFSTSPATAIVTTVVKPEATKERTSPPSPTTHAIDTSHPSASPSILPSPIAMQPVDFISPSAVLVNSSDGSEIIAYDIHGTALGSWKITTMGEQVHVAGPVTAEPNSTPLVYWGGEEGNQRLYAYQAGENTPLRNLNPPVMLTAIIGIPAGPVIAYSTMEPAKEGTVLHSRVYLSEYQLLPNANPVLIIESKESQFITPISIRTEEGKPVGFWFTYHYYGIGGGHFLSNNNHGLYYFDIPGNTISEILSPEKPFNDLSANQAHIAWIPEPASGAMQWTDIANGTTTSFPKRDESERNAGHGKLSPSGKHIAWVEGTNMDPGLVPVLTVRVADQSGEVIAEYSHEQFGAASGFGMNSLIKILGWFSEESLLLEVRQPGIEALSVVLQVDITTGEVSLLAPGAFRGFAYP